mmetsp:Transcript_52120/g.150205  ORF Transcript_52120/g.150205 Transcript_52120/m.150205 type:complete len:234 (-) Transcript_52120:508-1209(-)
MQKVSALRSKSERALQNQSECAVASRDAADIVAIVVRVPQRVLGAARRQGLASLSTILDIVGASRCVVRGLVDEGADLLLAHCKEEVAQVHIKPVPRVLLRSAAPCARVDVREHTGRARGARVDECGVGQHVVDRIEHHLNPGPGCAVRQRPTPEEHCRLIPGSIRRECSKRYVDVCLRLPQPLPQQLLLGGRAEDCRTIGCRRLNDRVQSGIDAEELGNSHGQLFDGVLEGG